MDHGDRPQKATRRRAQTARSRPAGGARAGLCRALRHHRGQAAGPISRRKLRERGWVGDEREPDDGDAPPPADIEALIARFVAHGYVDDAGYARMRSADLLAARLWRAAGVAAA